MKKLFFIFNIIFVLFNIAFANDNNFVNQVFKELDINKDGIIDKNDLQKFSTNEFKLMDINKDNLISKAEFFEFVCNKSCKYENCECKNYSIKEDLPYLKEYWDKVDINNDDYITKDEKSNADLNNFYGLDTNGDGKVNKEEVEAQLY